MIYHLPEQLSLKTHFCFMQYIITLNVLLQFTHPSPPLDNIQVMVIVYYVSSGTLNPTHSLQFTQFIHYPYLCLIILLYCVSLSALMCMFNSFLMYFVVCLSSCIFCNCKAQWTHATKSVYQLHVISHNISALGADCIKFTFALRII